MSRFKLLAAAVAGCCMLGATYVRATTFAFDNAADPAYNDPSNPQFSGGWTEGGQPGGGFGFSAWTLTTTPAPPSDPGATAGFILETSSNNGNGSSGNIDSSGQSWGMFANGGRTTRAQRFFNTALISGFQFNVDIDTGFIDSSMGDSMTLNNSNGVNLFEFGFTGGQNDYYVKDANGFTDTGVGFTADGLHLSLFLTSPTTYFLAITPNGGSTTTLEGTLVSDIFDNETIDGVNFYNFSAGNGQQGDIGSNNYYFNNLEISDAVPEPATLGVLSLGGMGLLLRRRRK